MREAELKRRMSKTEDWRIYYAGIIGSLLESIRRATWRMRSASARDEPPYFWTTSWDMAPIIPKRAVASAWQVRVDTTKTTG